MKHAFFAGLVLFLAGADLGAQAEDGYYLELDAGLSLVNDYVDSGFGFGDVTVSFDNAAHFGGAIGYRFHRHYRGEINISHRKADVRQVGGMAGTGTAELTSFMANLYYDFKPSSKMRPYVGLGLGLPMEDIDATSAMNTVETSDPDGIAWNLMAGASYRIHDRIDLNFGYRYLGVFAELDYMQFNEFLIGVRFNL